MWHHHFDRYQVALKLNKDSGEVQLNMPLYAIGREAEAIYNSFVELDYTKVMKNSVPKHNLIHTYIHEYAFISPCRG